MIGNILDNTTELHMIKYTFGEIFSSGGATLCKNPSDQTVQILFDISLKSLDIGSPFKTPISYGLSHEFSAKSL